MIEALILFLLAAMVALAFVWSMCQVAQDADERAAKMIDDYTSALETEHQARKKRYEDALKNH